MHQQTTSVNIDYVQHELTLAIKLLTIGFLKVSENPNTDEAVIMRISRTVLETLSNNIDKQAKGGVCCDQKRTHSLNRHNRPSGNSHRGLKQSHIAR